MATRNAKLALEEMDALKAIDIMEGTEQASEYLTLQAMAYLVKNGYTDHLQGYYGRYAQRLIDAGYMDRYGNITASGRTLRLTDEG